MKSPTQEDADKIHPAAIKQWNEMLARSGKSDLMFKISSEGTAFMAQYQELKEHVESEGFKVPDLFEGTTITFSEVPHD